MGAGNKAKSMWGKGIKIIFGKKIHVDDVGGAVVKLVKFLVFIHDLEKIHVRGGGFKNIKEKNYVGGG